MCGGLTLWCGPERPCAMVAEWNCHSLQLSPIISNLPFSCKAVLDTKQQGLWKHRLGTIMAFKMHSPPWSDAYFSEGEEKPHMPQNIFPKQIYLFIIQFVKPSWVSSDKLNSQAISLQKKKNYERRNLPQFLPPFPIKQFWEEGFGGNFQKTARSSVNSHLNPICSCQVFTCNDLIDSVPA